MSPEGVKKALLGTGSTPLTPCEGGPQGYFTGDPDQYKEPLLFRNLGAKWLHGTKMTVLHKLTSIITNLVIPVNGKIPN